MGMKTLSGRPGLAAFIAVLCALPFAALNVVIAERIEPFHSWIAARALNDAAGFGPGFFVLLFVLLPIPAGALVALQPVLRRGPDGRRRWPAINLGLAALMLGAFGLIAAGLGEEIYRCEIQRIPNCD